MHILVHLINLVIGRLDPLSRQCHIRQGNQQVDEQPKGVRTGLLSVILPGENLVGVDTDHVLDEERKLVKVQNICQNRDSGSDVERVLSREHDGLLIDEFLMTPLGSSSCQFF